MALHLPPSPQPVSYAIRPERPDQIDTRLEHLAHQWLGPLKRVFSSTRSHKRMLDRIEQYGQNLVDLTSQELDQQRIVVQTQLRQQGFNEVLIIETFAIVREQAKRQLGMYHYRSQLSGGLIMLQGMVAEMETGEGKTLTASLTAATMALAGVPVHVISVNDYLTQRDAEQLTPLYQALGLTTGQIIHGQNHQQRKAAYACDIVYATNKELVFDYLRDRLTLGHKLDSLHLEAESLYKDSPRSQRLLMRGLHFALVDEADSILIDEARTPLIISGGQGSNEEQAFYEQALFIAGQLEQNEDFILDQGLRQALLLDSGKEKISRLCHEFGPLWNGQVRRESTIHQALQAVHFYHRDEQYLIRDGKIQIIDEFTGRVMADRSWEQGLHQLLEMKEGCELSQQREALAKISFQRFFRRYLHLAGMTGTAREITGELWSVYRLQTIRVTPHRPIIRKSLPNHIFSHEEDKWQNIIKRVSQLHNRKRPVLIGTRSVAASEHLSRLAREAGIPHQVLNAKQDASEAAIVEQAGQAAMVTIATNMAGRGTDIKLGAGIKKLGGLHVITTERHEAARIDRQLAGRCGRQGDPGSYEGFFSLEDALLDPARCGYKARLLASIANLCPPLRNLLGGLAINLAQSHIERYHAVIRKELFRRDQTQGSLLSFSGRLE